MMTRRCATTRNYAQRLRAFLAAFIAICFGVNGASLMHAAPASPAGSLLVGYIPCYQGGNFASYAGKLDFTKMTHVNLAFGNPPKCDGVCTAKSNMTFGIKGESDADIDSFVTAAHAAGAKDQLILQFYNAGLSNALVASLDKFVTTHKLDGVDVDIEDPSNMGAPFAGFVSTVVNKFRPRGLLITAAVAKYMQDSMPDSALHQFDFINVMNYASYAGALTQLEFYSVQKNVPKNQIVLGVPFFGSNTSDTKEEDYATILAAYPNAWKVDMAGGGTLDDGEAFNYVGEDTMAKETLLGKQYGGIMIWQLLSDAPAPHSLLKVIQKNF